MALQAIDANTFDLIMLDYKLPDMTGLDVLRHLRQADQETVAIMMTAYSNIDDAVEAIKLGAFDYIAKPFQMDELLLTVDAEAVKAELPQTEAHLAQFGDRLPPAVSEELDALKARLG